MLGGAAFARAGLGLKPVEPTLVAQFGIGNILGTGKDLAVKSALSAFGKSLSGQLPIDVPSGDAFATVPTLAGAPFAPAATPNIAAALRASRDGTIALPPGDFAFPVDVFCMRVHAGSPLAHRYLVAPLHGSAADIVSALNSRIPSYAVDHHVLQVLSWDIQAGMAYAEMQPDQRAAVDRIIPEYRSRLDGDVYERIRGDYTRTTQSIPGMPSFEAALTRVGPVGAQVVALQNLRQELAQPPPTFAELARALVPALPSGRAAAPGGSSGPDGETPWSRYSDRVSMRFVTAGDYSTPGTYQVRVLPPAGSVVSRPATVPFTNIVSNPGSDAVQPLTQTPRVPLPPVPTAAPQPSPSPSSTPRITSETVAMTPFNRDRKTVGVGEEVTLTFSKGEASWSLSGRYDSAVIRPSDGSVEPMTGSTITYTAASVPAVETITARSGRSQASITFYVIAPSGLVNRRILSLPILHHSGRPDSGMQVESYVTPASVSFENINVIEREVGAIGTGVYEPFNGIGHDPNTVALPAGPVVPGLGSKMNWIDLCYSGDPRTNAPFVPGALVFKIPYEYQLRAGGDFHPFAIVTQASALQTDAETLDTSKAGAGVTVTISEHTTYPKSWVSRSEFLRQSRP